MTTKNTPWKITIIGSGFGGLSTIRELRKLDIQAEITLITPRAELQYLPGIIWIPSGIRSKKNLLIPLDKFFSRMRVNFFAADVTGLRDGGRVVETSDGEVANDILVIASGGRFIKKLEGIEHAITPCEGIAAAEKIRDRLRNMTSGSIAVGFAGNPNEPTAVRGGPMFEFLFGIDQQLRNEGRRERFEITFFNPSAEPGNRLGQKAVEYLLKEMHRRDIHTQLGNKLRRFEDKKVITEGGEFSADLILFMPGITGNVWFDNTTLPRSSGGLLSVDAHCRVPDHPRVYVVGDSGSFPGPDWMPKQAHMADLQAKAAALNIRGDIEGKLTNASFKVELLCIIDSLNKGTLVWRTQNHNVILPSMRLFHWLKRGFELLYLRKYK